ncbi:MAG: peroxide stress protein YaaA, partial [Actinobacteria bacterium]|nr:peroxide stress protein YaaA [Actinomycetota bacterium]
MLVLLPPSETKSAPASGPTLDLTGLSAPELTPARSAVLDALVALVGQSAAPHAAAVLGTGPSLADEVERNARLREEATARAATVYTGVLYAAAGLAALPPAAARRARDQVRIISALWGAVSPADLIPAYRLSMGTDLPGVGPLAAFWRARLPQALDPIAGDLVVDCRSSTYAAAWTPPPGVRWVQVRVEQQVGDRRRVVSHHAKHARGLLTGHLMRYRGHAPHDAGSLRAV